MSIVTIITRGADNLPALTDDPTKLRILRLAYQSAIRDVFVFLLVAGGLAFVASFGFEHNNVHKVREDNQVTEVSRRQDSTN
jgi:hypothetical protein